jgi:hypothetical protein
MNRATITAGSTSLTIGANPFRKPAHKRDIFVQKVEAIATHRSQFPIQSDLLPLAILQALMGQEYFVLVSLVSEVEPEFLALQGGIMNESGFYKGRHFIMWNWSVNGSTR